MNGLRILEKEPLKEKLCLKKVSGCFAAGSGLIGFIIGFILGFALFDEILSKLYSVVGEVSFVIALLFPPMAGICLGGLFATLGGIILILFRRR